MKRGHAILAIPLVFLALFAGCTKSRPAGATEVAATGALATFIELGSVKCIPCKMMQPIMRDIETTYAGQVRVVFHDVWTDQGAPFARKYGIRVIPTQIFLDANGVEYYRHEGFFPRDQLVAILKSKGVK
jgi:thioredoxin 1